MEKVTIENYTQMALRTWGGDNQKERAELGIIGELGEVCEVEKKFLRSDFGVEERKKRLIKELGDLLYYTAINIYLNGKSFYYCFKRYDDGSSCMMPIPCHAKLIVSNIENNELLLLNVKDLIFDLGFDLEQVMQANIDKLTKRAKENKIQGDGSNR